MNYFAHGMKYVAEPYFLIGTAMPDMLSVIDRQVRLRAKGVQPWITAEDQRVAAFAAGVMQHFSDDDWFHQTAAFNDLNVRFTGLFREHLPEDNGYRPAFLGHILVEILLDDWLVQQSPAVLHAYYDSLAAVDANLIQEAVNRMASRSTERIVGFIPRFLQERFLYDYADDNKLWGRLNQVMRRVGLPPLPESLRDLFPACRNLVASRAQELLQSGERIPFP